MPKRATREPTLFGAVVRKLRAKRQVGPKAMAEESHIPRSTIYAVEVGDMPPDLALCGAIAVWGRLDDGELQELVEALIATNEVVSIPASLEAARSKDLFRVVLSAVQEIMKRSMESTGAVDKPVERGKVSEEKGRNDGLISSSG